MIFRKSKYSLSWGKMPFIKAEWLNPIPQISGLIRFSLCLLGDFGLRLQPF
jgi:hypothetical protein